MPRFAYHIWLTVNAACRRMPLSALLSRSVPATAESYPVTIIELYDCYRVTTSSGPPAGGCRLPRRIHGSPLPLPSHYSRLPPTTQSGHRGRHGAGTGRGRYPERIIELYDCFWVLHRPCRLPADAAFRTAIAMICRCRHIIAGSPPHNPGTGAGMGAEAATGSGRRMPPAP